MNEKPVEEVPSGDVKAELKNQEQQLRLVCLKGKMTHFYILILTAQLEIWKYRQTQG